MFIAAQQKINLIKMSSYSSLIETIEVINAYMYHQAAVAGAKSFHCSWSVEFSGRRTVDADSHQILQHTSVYSLSLEHQSIFIQRIVLNRLFTFALLTGSSKSFQVKELLMMKSDHQSPKLYALDISCISAVLLKVIHSSMILVTRTSRLRRKSFK